MLRTLKNLFKQDREKFVVPKSVQNVIPIKTIWDDGIFLVGRNKYAKTFKFEDINYAVASREDKEAMFLEYSELLNSLDSGATTKITINNRRLNKADFEQTILIPMADDGLDKYRKEYNKMLLDKATGANSIVQDKYVTVSVCKKNIEEARNYFARVGADLIAHFNRLGSKCVELDAGDKLRIFHDFYRTGEETAFHFDITQTMRKGHDFKDFICPDTFEFESDCFRMGDRYGRVIFLREYAAYIKDSTPVSAEVEAYEPLIQKYAKQYGIPEYVELIKAVMMQESGGRGLDPMQAAEGSFNTRYPHEPNGIQDPEYSIECGVQELKAALISAEVENPIDMEHIKLALQGYNFGNGYISWAKTNYGGYSYANAVEFSTMQAARLGWDSYGDTQYPAHVLRYYPYGRAFTSGGNQAIVEVALTQLGNEGGQPYWSWYGFEGRVEWCACFVSWCADQCGYIESGIIPKFAGCVDGANWFKGNGQWKDRSYEPSAGDIIFFDWEGDGETDHVGIVEKCENGVVYTVEGNSGDTCRQNQYTVGSSSIYGYGVPAY